MNDTILLASNQETMMAMETAQAIAREFRHGMFGPGHLLKGLLQNELGLASQLSLWDYDIHYLRDWANLRIEEYPKTGRPKEQPAGDESVQKVLEVADIIRLKLGDETISPLAILIAMTRPNLAFTAGELKSFPCTEKDLLENFLQEIPAEQAVQSRQSKDSGLGTKALLTYCSDKTAQAAEGRFDPIVGREKELRSIAEILGRRTKPNVIITGEPGIGKTALVEGFAQLIADGLVPQQLSTAVLFELDLGALIAGAAYRGEVEARLKNILAELRLIDKAILFIDEIHVLLDSKGSFSGVANLLKPELARGEVTVIGATTQAEYRKYIETDDAFNRRFEQLAVEEPNPAVALRMMRAQVPIYEKHHGIAVTDESLVEAVRLAQRYIKERCLPDAAIDLMDRTMAAIQLSNETGVKILEQFQLDLEQVSINTSKQEEVMLKELQWLHLQLKNALSPTLLGRWEQDVKAIPSLDAQKYLVYLQQMLAQLSQYAQEKKETIEVADVAAMVAYKTGIPLGSIQQKERDKLLSMEAELRQRVMGQDHALKVVADAILESRSGLANSQKPIGSFFLMGPTGTGKTELAKSVAALLFDDESTMLRFDMSEFKERHAAELLLGAPPGFVGHEEGGLLVNAIRQKPYSVVLFDEIEKAHPSIFDLFLQIMDEGKLNDRLGKAGDFSNAIIFFTSNLGVESITRNAKLETLPSSDELMETMTKHFRKEFLARLTEIVPFNPIKEKDLLAIFNRQLQPLGTALSQQGILLDIPVNTKKHLASIGYSPEYGVRPLQAVIRQQLQRPLSRKIISGELIKGMSIKAELDTENNIRWTTTTINNLNTESHARI